MYFDSLNKEQQETFVKKGDLVMDILIKGDWMSYCDPINIIIYRKKGSYVIITDWGEGYGPAYSLLDIVEWEGLSKNIVDFEISSPSLNYFEMVEIEKTITENMVDNATRLPALIPGINFDLFWARIEQHLQCPGYLNPQDLFAYLKIRSVYAGPNLEKIVLLAQKEDYLKMLYNFGIDTIQELMGYFLEQEEYQVCKSIHKTIIDHNALTDNNLCSIKDLVKTNENTSETHEGV